MDQGRKMGKTEKPNATFRKCHSSPCLAFEAPFLPDVPIAEDRCLVNWKKWLANRQKHYKTYKSVVGRHQADLVMNECEKIRPSIETKNLMDYLAVPIPQTHDKYRGNPAFWKTPGTLPNRGNPCLPTISATLNRKEMNMSPDFEYVDVPRLIRREKDLLPLREDVRNWKRSAYLLEKKEKLAEVIALLEPCKPDTAELMVQGHGYGQAEENLRKIPVLSITNDSSECDLIGPVVDPDIAVILRIQETEIVRDDDLFNPGKGTSDPISWSLLFESVVNQRAECILRLENKGTIVVTYQWRNASFESPLLPLTKRGICFFFNKNRGLILPGQVMEFPVWFESSCLGIFSEEWQLETEPEVHPGPLLFRFWAFAAADSATLREEESIQAYLDRCLRDSSIRAALEDTLHSIEAAKPPEPAYRSLFVEGDVFRAKNPSYFYHPSLVVELHKIHETLAEPGTWNLSLVDLRTVLLQTKKPEVRHAMLVRFSELCRECLKPCSFETLGNTKCKIVYNIFCALANKIEDVSEDLKADCLLRDGSCILLEQLEARSSGSVSRSSVGSATPRAKRSSKTSKVSVNDKMRVSEAKQRVSVTVVPKNVALYKEVFFVRVYGLLAEAIEQACAAIDSLNNLNELEK